MKWWSGGAVEWWSGGVSWRLYRPEVLGKVVSVLANGWLVVNGIFVMSASFSDQT